MSLFTPTLCPMNDGFAVYGRSEEDHDAIANALTFAEPPREKGARHVSLDFHTSAHDVSMYGHVYGVPDTETKSRPANDYFSLDQFRPYLPHMEPIRLKRLVRHAMTHETGRGSLSANFLPSEDKFLRRALPQIITHKLLARKDSQEPITFEVKVLGMGFYATEFPELLQRFLIELDRQHPTPMAVTALLHGFDYCTHTTGGCWENLEAGIHRAKRSQSHEAQVTTHLHYGDLTDEDSRDVMLAHGRPDITLWRRTWVFLNGLISAEQVDKMRATIAASANRPGAFLMYETGPFNIQDLYPLFPIASPPIIS